MSGTSVSLGSLSPRSFKSELGRLRNDMDSFQESLSLLQDYFRAYSDSGSLRDGNRLGEIITQLGTENRISYQAQEVARIGETLLGIEQQRRQLLESIRPLILSPLEQFLRDDIPEVETVRGEADAMRKEYDQAQLRYDVARTKSSKGKTVSRTTQSALEEAKRTMEAAELTYGNKLQDVRVKKEFELLERLCSYVFAEANFYHESHKRLTRLEPAVRSLMKSLVHAQKDYLEGKGTTADVDEIVARSQAPTHSTPVEIDLHFKQGYVNLKKKGGGWTRRWLVVNKGLLFLHKTWKELEPIKCANLLLCTVKQVASDRPNTLMVISPELSLTIQALDEEDLKQWIAVVEAGIGWQLTKKQQDSQEQKSMTSTQEKFSYLRDLRVIEANRFCADCGAPDPEWGLMNLSVLICFECSGVHRSLGVHISKVRSLTLDEWNPELFHLIEFFGNEKGNQIFEAQYDESVPKPTRNSERGVRDAFIRAKYEERKFVTPFTGSPEEHQKLMLDACNEGNLYQVMECINQGCDPNFFVDDPEQKICLLSQVVITGTATTYVLELLIQNGAQVFSTDVRGWTPLHYAALHDRVTYARMLVLRGASTTCEDKARKSPFNIAEERPNSQTLRYFNGEIRNEDLAGAQPADIESLNQIKTNFVAGADLVRSKLNVLRQELRATESVDDAVEILRQIRLVKLALCFDSA